MRPEVGSPKSEESNYIALPDIRPLASVQGPESGVRVRASGRSRAWKSDLQSQVIGPKMIPISAAVPIRNTFHFTHCPALFYAQIPLNNMLTIKRFSIKMTKSEIEGKLAKT